MIEIFQRRSEGDGEGVALFTKSALKILGADEHPLFWQTVSDSLEGANSDSEFTSVIRFAELDWSKVSEIARIRAEHRLIESIKEGRYNKLKQECIEGHLGSWSRDVAKQFTLKSEFLAAVAAKLCSDNRTQRNYAFEFCFGAYCELVPKPSHWLISHLKKRLKEHDQATHDALWEIVDPVSDPPDEWTKAFLQPIMEFEPKTEDEIPF
jgi:hypothetical protein